MVAAHQQQPDLAFDNHALVVGFVCSQDQRLDRGGQRHAQQLGHVFTSAFAWGRCQRASCRSRAARLRRCQSLGFFHVGRVIAVRAIHDGVFAGSGNHLKLFAQVAADSAAVGRHGAVTQTEAVKNAAVSLRHALVTDLRRSSVAVKAVRVFHDELAPAHQAKPRSALVAKLGLYLVKIFR